MFAISPNNKGGKFAEPLAMGPTCEVRLQCGSPAVLDVIDALLASIADQLQRTRKGRTWDLWIDGRPMHVVADENPPSICLSAGCNSSLDMELLRQLAHKLADAVGGVASEPIK